MFRILSIDGGGIRGVIPSVLLQQLEKRSGQPISALFDLIAGTSTGGILAVGLTVPGVRRKPKYTASDMVDLYANRGHEIFQRSFWRGLTSLGGVADEKYPAEPLEAILDDYAGKAKLAKTLVPIVVTSYDIERREPYFFKTRWAVEQADRNHYLRDVARATSAAPTYFEPAKVRSLADEPTRRVLIDGGVFANNPAMCAYVEACNMGVDPAEIVVVSLGTGVATRKIAYEDAKGWGAVGWVKPIISIMMDGVADSADYQLQQLLPDSHQPESQRYFRFNTPLDLALDDMDAANAGNIRALQAEAGQILEQQGAEFDRLVRLLTAKPADPPATA
ncbi:MAG: patatin-like phospholipase family protein [Alphaproteobacteria bacterium]|nr:patatin-like phospholipase family protein [Alphaproteobacteria bacterium]MCB9930814.1 patatin-like phospholipase family protein [Alphaproteobacteria bacterium]